MPRSPPCLPNLLPAWSLSCLPAGLRHLTLPPSTPHPPTHPTLPLLPALAAFSDVWLRDRLLVLCHVSAAPLMRGSLSHLASMQAAMAGLRAVSARWASACARGEAG